MGEKALEMLRGVNVVLWGPWTLYMLLGAGILFSVWTKFSQFRILSHGVAVIRGRYDDPSHPGVISHFQALSAALSGTIGLGNIGGVALAVALGGPGAIFWMWIVGFCGMALKAVEITLAMLYRNTEDPDNPHGGAMWVIDKTLGVRGGGWRILAKVLGGFFCISLLIWTMIGAVMFQAWNVAELTNTYFGVPQLGTGIVLAVIVALVIVGGIKRIGRVAGQLVPIMCILYVLSALAVLALHIDEIPTMLLLIVKSAFTPTAPVGAFAGGSVMLAFSAGLKRAFFSNEAGTGSAPIAHAAAKTNEPAREGIVGGMGPFIDTIVVCTMTALVIMATGTWNREPLGPLKGSVRLEQTDEGLRLIAPTDAAELPDVPSWDAYQPGSSVFFAVTVADDKEPAIRKRANLYGRLAAGSSGKVERIEWDEPSANTQWLRRADGTEDTRIFRDYKGASLTSHAFDLAFPGLGKWMVTIAALLFAVSTMITWSYYGEQCTFYMLGGRGTLYYKLILLALVVVGAVAVKTDKQLGVLLDFGTGWALWANMVIVLLMSRTAVRSLLDYFRRLDAKQF